MTPRRQRLRLKRHPFELDRALSAGDALRRQWCRRCGLPGRPGDTRHTMADPYPVTPPEALVVDARRLGERPNDEEADT